MTDTPTSEYGFRQQELGTNVNTWGDTKLNEVIQAIAQTIGSVKTVAITGDYTLTSTNYVTTADNKNAGFKFTGTLTAAANITVSSADAVYFVINATTGGFTLTVKTSAGTGVSIPASRQALVFCDSTNVLSAVSTTGGVASPTSASADIPAWSAVETAIANAGLPATSGTVLVSGTDTTAGYLGSKISVSGALSQTTDNPGANEVVALGVGSLAVTNGGAKTSGFTAAVNTRYNCLFAASGTITLPAAATADDVIILALADASIVYTVDPNGLNMNGVTDSIVFPSNNTITLTYSGAAQGWV